MDPSGSRVTIRAAKPDDAGEIERMELVCFEGDRLSRRSLAHHLQSPTADVLIAMLGGKAAGYAMVFYRSTSRLARLYSIATLPEARGKGVAAALMAAVERAACNRGCTGLRLEVRADNAGAIALYRRLGYAEFGRHENYYEDGAPALRFERSLSRNEARSRARAA
jgi:ribosomal-protein-alanine N-acetyltransferase